MGLAIQPEDRPQTVDEFRRLLGISVFDSGRDNSNRGSGRASRDALMFDDKAQVGKPEAAAKTNAKSKSNMFTKRSMVVAGLLVLLLAGAYVSSRSDKATTASNDSGLEQTASARGELKLSIKPWGMVSVDGEQNGVSPPLKKLNLSDGKHTIRISNPGFPDYSIEVEIGKDNVSTIEHEFTQK
jgi:hypothetical protein